MNPAAGSPPPSPSPSPLPLSALAWGALGGGLLLPFLSLPWFALGRWDKAEPLIVALHGAAALAALWLALAERRTPGLALALFRHPLTLLPLLLGLFSALTAPWTPLPRLTLLGAPQSGTGALWFLELALLTALGRMAVHHPPTLHRLTVLAMAAGGATALLKGWDWAVEGTERPHLLIWVAAYYAWLAPPLAVLLLARDPRGRRGWLLLGGGILLALAATSRSLTAGAALLGGAALWGGMTLWIRRAPAANAAPARIAAALLALTAVVAPLLLEEFVPPVRAVASIDDRYRLLRMLTEAIAQGDGLQWLLGVGWGRIGDAYQIHLQASGMTLWDGRWIFLQSDYFHAHNALLEAFHAAGAVGTLLLLGMIVAPPLFAPRERLPLAAGFALAHGALAGMWFPLALSLPITALALGYLSGPPPQPAPVAPKPSRRWALSALLGLAALGLAGVGGVMGHHGLALSDLARHLETGTPAAPLCLDAPGGDDLALAQLFRNALLAPDPSSQPEALARRLAVVGDIFQCLERKIPRTPTPLLVIVGLNLMERIQFTGEQAWAAPALAGRDPWAAWLDRALTLAPGRSDLALPFLTREAVAGRSETARRWVDRLLARHGGDPVGLYFLGILQLQAGERAEGVASLRRAVANGLERFMPLDQKVREILERS
ncbi:MAG: hypothetical protein HQL51_16395 [Magnetococcales bacterium]|nr:hypothetical protein [Magnetococcales bacterium]